MSGLWFYFLQPSFSQPRRASGYQAPEAATISEMLLMRFCKNPWLCSGDCGLCGFSVAGLQR